MAEKNNKTKQEILKNGASGEFWQIIKANLDENIKDLREQQNDEDFRTLPAEAYKLENELLKAKIEYFEKLKTIPEDLISWLEEPGNTVENFDPYLKTDVDIEAVESEP